MGDANQTDAPLSPADLVERNAPAPQPQANTTEVSPADLVERPQQGREGLSPGGLGLPADVLAKGEAAAAAVKAHIEEPAVNVGREELGQLPTQDPVRQHRPKL